MPDRVRIQKLASGVPGLDEVLGGGVPEFSFGLIAGAPGTGKTTLAQQMLFSVATEDRPGLFFTVLGEPPVKMMRYQQQFEFFDMSRVGRDVHFLNLSKEVLEQNLDGVLERISLEVERLNPAMVVVDSFRTVERSLGPSTAIERDLQQFVQRLALRLTSWETTSFLIGEFGSGEIQDPVFTIADTVIWLTNAVERSATVRRLRVGKIRGQPGLPGLHTMRIGDTGVVVFPRPVITPSQSISRLDMPPRLSTGIATLDEMMSGGVPEGDSVLVAGPTGTGKSIIATHFAVEGIPRGERAVIAVFEEQPSAYIRRVRQSLNVDLQKMVDDGMLDVMYLRPLDLTVEESLQEIRKRVHALGAKRLVIDSISGFESALADSFRVDFRESYYRLITTLTSQGITTWSTVEMSDGSDHLHFSPYNVSFFTDDIIALRFAEISGELHKVISVIKMRGSSHSRELRSFEIRNEGIVIQNAMREYRGVITGVPERLPDRPRPET